MLFNTISKVRKIIRSNLNIFMNILGAFIVKGGSMILSLFLLPAYIHFFGNKNILGVWYTILSILNWVLMFDLGIGNGLRNKLPEALVKKDNEKARSLVSSTYISTIIIVLVIGIIGFFIIHFLDWNSLLNVSADDLQPGVLKKAIRIAFFGIIIQFVLKLITSVLYAIQKSAFVNFLTLLSNCIIFIIISLLPASNAQDGIVLISYINILAVNLPLLIATIVLFWGKLRKMRPSFRFFDLSITKDVLGIGLTLLWLQLVFMIISSTNEFLISAFCGPADVVEYQVYFKIYNSIASVFSLMLVPIWSAVTKAQVERRFIWIKKAYQLLIGLAGMILIIGIGISFVLQPVVNLWLKEGSIVVKQMYAIIFAFSSYVFVIHIVNTSIGNGMSFFKPQTIFMTFAAVIDIPLAWIFVRIFGGWIGIVIANIVALLPFEIAEPIFFFGYINRLVRNNDNNCRI